MIIIDIHTHAFPDALAGRAVAELERQGGVSAFHGGTVGDLLASMDQAGIRTSVVASIATKPEQFAPILAWSKTVASDRIIPFPSVHPADPDAVSRIDEIADCGFAGLKLHPYYQDFVTDDEELFPLYRRIAERGLILLIHAGYDPAFSRAPRAKPAAMASVLENVPGLTMIISHLGGWEDWDEAERLIIGRPVYVDIAVSLEGDGNPKARDMILAHPEDYVLFGTDSPWGSQVSMVSAVKELGLSPAAERKLLYENAACLLGVSGG